MKKELFADHELCDGRFCVIRSECVRYMANVDINKPGVNLYVNFQSHGYPFMCPHFLSQPDEHYPQLADRVFPAGDIPQANA